MPFQVNGEMDKKNQWKYELDNDMTGCACEEILSGRSKVGGFEKTARKERSQVPEQLSKWEMMMVWDGKVKA